MFKRYGGGVLACEERGKKGTYLSNEGEQHTIHYPQPTTNRQSPNIKSQMYHETRFPQCRACRETDACDGGCEEGQDSGGGCCYDGEWFGEDRHGGW
jgi:radical SAM protein with 4Fe4S-binding SPASM domain